jgi:uncharacterized protein YutE (UPF0331/DUF86 family)
MPKTRVNCPNCHQPVITEVEQLFDIGVDPEAKSRLLSGASNMIRCAACGYQGNLATPIVYHDPGKELLLTFVPSELGLPMNEQERIIGPLINKAVSDLPQEKRKGYLFRPQTMLTFQGLIERILEADGITREMLQAQQQRMGLLQRLMEASSDDVRIEIAKQNDGLIDGDFFTLLRRVAEMAAMSGDRESVGQLSNMQKQLVSVTTFGKQLEAQTREVEAAVHSLQSLGDQLTQEKLLELVIQAPNDTRVNAIVSLTRPGMDYTFFGMLSQRIDKETGEEHARLLKLRERLLNLTQQIDRQMAEHTDQARQTLQAILESQNVVEATEQAIPIVDDIFIQVLGQEVEAARTKGDLERIGKLHQVEETIQKASAPPPELAFLDELVNTPDDTAMQAMLESRKPEVTPELLDSLSHLVSQPQAEQEPELFQRLQTLYQMMVRISMEKNLSR